MSSGKCPLGLRASWRRYGLLGKNSAQRIARVRRLALSRA